MIDKCGGTGWTEAGSSPAFTYSVQRRLDPGPHDPRRDRERDLTHEPVRPSPTAPDHLRVMLTFPERAGRHLPEQDVDHQLHVQRHAARQQRPLIRRLIPA